MRLIDADALVGVISGMYAAGDDGTSFHVDSEEDTLIGKFAVIDAIGDMPTAQPQIARWIEPPEEQPILFGGHLYIPPMKCSNCGRTALNEPWTFCPNCGAKMEVNNE